MILSSHHREVLMWSGGVLLTVVGILAVTISLDQIPGMENSTREPASYRPKTAFHPPAPTTGSPKTKEQLLKGNPKDATRNEKGSGSMRIEISSIGRHDITAGAPLELEATIEGLADLKDLEYAWHLPKGVTVETGSEQGQVGRLVEGEKKSVRITLQGQLADSQLVHLSVFRRMGKESIGNVGQFKIQKDRSPASTASSLSLGHEKSAQMQSIEANAAAHLVQ